MRILLADDNANLANTLSLWLSQKAGFELVGIATTTQGLAETILMTAADALLLDWELPGLPTEEDRHFLVNALRTRFPTLRIVVLRSDLLALPHAVSDMVNGYISKSESPDHLLDLLLSLNI